MPTLYLSPSTQEFNPYVTAGNEEYWMNVLADRMGPYLLASGVDSVRNNPDQGAAAAIRASNQGDYDFHLALHSNASPEARAGRNRGIEIYYAPASAEGLRMAEILVDNLKPIYPLPEKVRALSTTGIGEVAKTRAPAVLAELGYHDNRSDALWVEQNQETIARALALSVTEYFGVPFQEPRSIRQGTVTVQWGRLNIRDLPTTDSQVLTRAENGDQLTIYGENGNWYSVGFGDVIGYTMAAYVMVS